MRPILCFSTVILSFAPETSYYFRINPLFEMAAPQYDWINRVIAVGVGHRLADGPVYSVFEVL